MSLPRVTYSNIGVDFSPVHDHLDRLIPDFERDVLGKEWKTAFATNQPQRFASPIDPTLALGLFPSTSASDIDAAVQAAKNGAAIWNNSTVAERLDFAARWYKVLEEDKYQLGLAALYEVGKSRLEAIGEAEEAVDMLEFYPEELRKNNGYVRPMNELIEKETATSVLRPYGVFAVIAPFNFPVALSIGMIVGALLGGNSVVYKPSPECQLTGLLIAEGLRKAGLPDGVFNIVLGDGEVGRQLAQHKGVDGVAFTGSHKTGMSIFRNMANGPWMKPVIAEMGGKNPAYVTKNADIALPRKESFGLRSVCKVKNARLARSCMLMKTLRTSSFKNSRSSLKRSPWEILESGRPLWGLYTIRGRWSASNLQSKRSRKKVLSTMVAPHLAMTSPRTISSGHWPRCQGRLD